jgi:hypothetical protein
MTTREVARVPRVRAFVEHLRRSFRTKLDEFRAPPLDGFRSEKTR